MAMENPFLQTQWGRHASLDHLALTNVHLGAPLWNGYPLVVSKYVKVAIENGPFIVDLPIKNGDFP